MTVIRLRVSASDIKHLRKGQDLVYANGEIIIHYEPPKSNNQNESRGKE